MKKIILTTAVFVMFMMPARAAEPEMWSCTPQTGLHVMKFIPGARHAAELMITGTLDVPTPGYGYTLDHQTGENNQLVAVLHLTGPSLATAAVISALSIEESFGVDPALTRLEITFEKNFQWGPDQIVCEPVS